LLEVVPAHFELLDIGHVRHRTAGGEVWQHDLLVVGAQDVRAFSHEMHAAKDDEVGIWMAADLLRKLEGVAGVIGEPDHLVALIVMTEDDEARTERRPGGRDADVHFLVRQSEIALRKRLAFPDVFLLVGRQNWKQHRRFVKLFAI
jgi:hypothetical protein